jgi:hypothetical protein
MQDGPLLYRVATPVAIKSGFSLHLANADGSTMSMLLQVGSAVSRACRECVMPELLKGSKGNSMDHVAHAVSRRAMATISVRTPGGGGYGGGAS